MAKSHQTGPSKLTVIKILFANTELYILLFVLLKTKSYNASHKIILCNMFIQMIQKLIKRRHNFIELQGPCFRSHYFHFCRHQLLSYTDEASLAETVHCFISKLVAEDIQYWPIICTPKVALLTLYSLFYNLRLTLGYFIIIRFLANFVLV